MIDIFKSVSLNTNSSINDSLTSSAGYNCDFEKITLDKFNFTPNFLPSPAGKWNGTYNPHTMKTVDAYDLHTYTKGGYQGKYDFETDWRKADIIDR